MSKSVYAVTSLEAIADKHGMSVDAVQDYFSHEQSGMYRPLRGQDLDEMRDIARVANVPSQLIARRKPANVAPKAQPHKWYGGGKKQPSIAQLQMEGKLPKPGATRIAKKRKSKTK